MTTKKSSNADQLKSTPFKLTESETNQILDSYAQRFQVCLPEPWGIGSYTIALKLKECLESGSPLDPKYDWWADLPPGALP